MIGAIVVAFPVAESMRTYLRVVMPNQPLPSLYRTDAENRPCAECGMTLNVGPRSLALLASTPGLQVVCPLCVLYVTQNLESTDTVSLGNPESGWEGERSS